MTRRIERPTLATGRLVLVAGDAALGRAELAGKDKLGELLGAAVPPAWPPPLNDEASVTWFTEYAESHPEDVGWAMWYFLAKQPGAKPTAIGNGGFKGGPDDQGAVEVGYSVLEEYQRRGYATEAVEALISWAFPADGGNSS